MAKNPFNSPEREKAGIEAVIKFDFQYHWGLLQALNYYRDDVEFLIVIEKYDDVLIALCKDTSQPMSPSNVNVVFTQVKSYKSPFSIKKISKPDSRKPNSIIGKMLIGAQNQPFYNDLSVLALVSAKGFNFKNKDDTNPKYFSIEELKTQDLTTVKSNLNDEFNSQELTFDEDLFKKIQLHQTELPSEEFRNHLIGEITNILEDKFPKETFKIVQIYRALMDELGRRSKIPYDYADWDDFINNKVIRLKDIDKVRKIHQRDNEILKESFLIKSIDFNPIEMMKINKEFINHHNLLRDVAGNIAENHLFELVKNFIETHESIVDNDNLKYRDDFFKAVESFSDEIKTLCNQDKVRMVAVLIYNIEKTFG